MTVLQPIDKCHCSVDLILYSWIFADRKAVIFWITSRLKPAPVIEVGAPTSVIPSLSRSTILLRVAHHWATVLFGTMKQVGPMVGRWEWKGDAGLQGQRANHSDSVPIVGHTAACRARE